MKKHKIRLTKKPRVVMSSQAEFLKEALETKNPDNKYNS